MSEPIARLRIELEEIEPVIWRAVDVPASLRLLAFHDVIQAAMGWEDAHLFEFHVGERVYSLPFADDPVWDRRVYNAANIRIRDLIKRGVERFRYVYDLGDNWRHRLTIESVDEGAPERDYPRFVDGRRRCPPEDVGGVIGYFDFLEAVMDPTHEDHEQMVTWYGGPYDPDDIEPDRIRRYLDHLAARRRIGVANDPKSRKAK